MDNKSDNKKGFLITALTVILLVLAIMVIGMVIKKITDRPKEEIVQNVARLKAMEEKDVTQIVIPDEPVVATSESGTSPTEAAVTEIGEKNAADGVVENNPERDGETSADIPEQPSAELTAAAAAAAGVTQAAGNTNLPAEMTPSRSNDEITALDDVSILQKFRGTVILGDSITESIWEFGFLDKDVVLSEIGLSVSDADDLVDTAISLSPKAIFMAFGTNDMTGYGSDAAGFAASYKKQVEKLQNALPGVPIYINSVLPVTQEAIDEQPELKYYPEYDAALMELCSEMGCGFIDRSFIVQNDPDYFEPDGIHVVANFYPLWLGVMAEAAGL